MSNIGIVASLGLGIGSSQLPFPLVNGFAYSYASVELKVTLPGGGLKIYKGVRSINYKAPTEVTKLWGSSTNPYAQTIGKQDYEAELEMYLAESVDLQTNIGPGFTQIFFDVSVTYQTPGYLLFTDLIQSCRLLSPEQAITMGTTEGLVRKFTLNPMNIIYNGMSTSLNPISPTA